MEMAFFDNFKSSLSYRTIYRLCHLICTLATAFFILYCLYQYSLNNDVSQVTYKEFHHTEENIYPSLTVCFKNIFYEENLNRYGLNNSIQYYSRYLEGDYWDDRMSEVDYDNVTKRIDSYLLGIGMWTPDWTPFMYGHRLASTSAKNDSANVVHRDDWKPKFYTSYKGSSKKCLTVDIPYSQGRKVWTFGAVFDSTIFPMSIRPSYYQFGVKVHYPGQVLRHQMLKYVWKERNTNSSRHLAMKFKIQKLEVIKHRETGIQACNKNWKEDDESMMLQEIKKIGCKPSFLEIGTNFPICKSQVQLKMFAEFNASNYKPPCKSIQKILYSYDENEPLEEWVEQWMGQINKVFGVAIEFTDGTYMEIEQVRDYGIHDVVGDIGGYLGLFLGFALLQIPEGLFTIASWVHNLVYGKTEKVEPEMSTIQQIKFEYRHENLERKNEIEMIRKELKMLRSKQLNYPLDLVSNDV